MNKDYYSILNVSKNATDDEIKKAFRKLSMQYHPDRQVGKTEAEKKTAEEKFKEISEAYDTLGDKDKRQKYDMFGSSGSTSADDDMMSRFASQFGRFGFGFEDMFGGSPFGRTRSTPDPNSPEDGADVQINLNVTFKESLFGVVKEFDIDVEEPCNACNGTGTADGKGLKKCSHCNGTGMFTQVHGRMMVQSTCSYCQGQGYMNSSPCQKCHGSRRCTKMKHVSLKIPAGVHNGSRLRIAGSGQSGLKGGKSGDLYVQLRVEESKLFQRNGYDLYTDLYISPIIASIGGDADVYTPYGTIKIKIPAGTIAGKQLRVPNKGIKTSTANGDLILNVQIEPLVNLSKEQKDLLKAFNNTVSAKNLQVSEQRRKELQQMFN